jgi:hypothetical protein
VNEPALSDQDLDHLAGILTEKIAKHKKALWIESEIHAEDHGWIKQRRQDEADIREFRKRVLQSATIWAVILAIGFISVATWKAVIAAAKSTGL